jgi:hypothetical protein
MRIMLNSGAYEARSIIANAQRCINLFPERNSEDAPVPFTHYATPGLDLLILGTGSQARATYRASNGDFYNVIGSAVYYIDSNFNRTLLGNITYGTTPVSLSDNGLVIVIVDGSTNGWVIDMATHAFGTIPTASGGPFFGSPRVDYLDTFLLFSRPGTNQWYISLSEANFAMFTSLFGAILTASTVGGTGYTDGTYTNIALSGGSGGGATGTLTILGGIVTKVLPVNAGVGYAIGDTLTATGIGGGTGFAYQVETIGGAFDALDIATKNGSPDPIVALIVMHREVWLIGQLTTEIWYNSGAADFTFQAMPGAFVEHGSDATYALCAQDLSVYWLSLDRQGRAIFMRGAEYQALRISTHAIENEWATYPTTQDAISFVYQQEGHTFVFVVFPSGNATWVYDQAAQLWHQRAWTDNDGNLNRHRANCVANVYNTTVVGDWQNGNLYKFDMNQFTDDMDGNGLNTDGSYPISCIRSFPHELNDGKRVTYGRFAADIQVGTDVGVLDSSTPTSPPVISLRWSDNRGASYGNKVEQSLGAAGQYLTQPSWGRLGIARDRIFELSWSCPTMTALNGAFVDITPAGS